MDIEQIEIDNEIYNILDKITYDNTTYYYLQNDKTEKILIKKLENDNLVDISNDEEIKKAFIVFSHKYIKDAS